MDKVIVDMARNLRCRPRVPRAGGAWGKQRLRPPEDRENQNRSGSHSDVGEMLEGCWMGIVCAYV